jgi:hypothetical protein
MRLQSRQQGGLHAGRKAIDTFNHAGTTILPVNAELQRRIKKWRMN